jgi:GNAT superfamily N-acetyltransferase
MPKGCLALRPLGADEESLLHRIVYTAATFRPEPPGGHADQATMLADPHLVPYVEDWGRSGDRCLVATVDDAPVGGAFSRLFTAERQADAFVDEQTPELGIALFAEHRSTGLGRALLQAIITQARLDGAPAISLGVADDNRARALYESAGFVTHRLLKGGQAMVLRF